MSLLTIILSTQVRSLTRVISRGKTPRGPLLLLLGPFSCRSMIWLLGHHGYAQSGNKHSIYNESLLNDFVRDS